MEQRIEYCSTNDGVQLAYSSIGVGPPIVKAANWLNHLEFDLESPVWKHLYRALAQRHTLIRFDQRGNGLSDWSVPEFSFDTYLEDLEAVVEAAGVERFALLGISQGCAVSIAYAVKHPERVSHLILHGGYVRGRTLRSSRQELETFEALLTLTKAGWGQDNKAFHQIWTSLFMPGARPEEADFWNELQRATTSPENAVSIFRSNAEIDVRSLLAEVSCPTLVTHSRGDLVSPLTQARELASGIRGARLVVLETSNHLLLEHDPAWPVFLHAIEEHLGVATSSLRRQAEQAGDGERRSVLEPGRRLGRFVIERHLASGGMGDVYAARDPKLDRLVALKVLPAGDLDARHRFETEAKAVAALAHPNILSIFELGEDSGVHFAVAELLEGESLRSRLRRGPLPVPTAIELARQICSGLDAAHCKGIVHRDLKPENLWLLPDGRLKILDFGLVKIEADSPLAGTRRAGAATLPGTLLGTVGYMAPEQVRAEPADARTDLFALGVVLYEMITGQLPFRGASAPDMLSAILRDEPRQIDSVELPRTLLRLLQRALAKSPGERFQTASDFGFMLQAADESLQRNT